MPTPPNVHALLSSGDSFRADPDCDCLQCRIARLEHESIPAINSQITQVVNNSITPIDSRLAQLEKEFLDFQGRYNTLLQNYNALRQERQVLQEDLWTVEGLYQEKVKELKEKTASLDRVQAKYTNLNERYDNVSRQAEFYLVVIHAIIQATYTLEIDSNHFGNELNESSTVRFIFPPMEVTNPTKVASVDNIELPVQNDYIGNPYDMANPFDRIQYSPTTEMVDFYQWVQDVMNHVPLNVRPLWSLDLKRESIGVHEMNFAGKLWFLTPVNYESRLTREDAHYLNLGGVSVRTSEAPDIRAINTNWTWDWIFWGDGIVPEGTPTLYYTKEFDEMLDKCSEYAWGFFGNGYPYGTHDFKFGRIVHRGSDSRYAVQVVK